MQLLGISGAAVATPASGIFSYESMLIGGGGHYVFDRGAPPLMRPRGRFYQNTGDDFYMGTRLTSRRPRTPNVSSLVFQGKPVEDPDPMVGFFLGATSLQDGIKFEPNYNGMNLFTVVHMPILAMPLQERGYILQCEISQFYADKEDIVNLSDAVSTAGQIPIDAPSDLDLKFMNMLASEFYRLGNRGQPNVNNLVRSLRQNTGVWTGGPYKA
jgi:hypothetical protein